MRRCPVDGTPLTGQASQRYCSEKCSKRARRAANVVRIPQSDTPGHGAVEASVRAELEAAGRHETGLGAGALLLAARIDSGQETGSGLASLHRELRQTLAEALRTAARTPVAGMRDELAERRRGA